MNWNATNRFLIANINRQSKDTASVYGFGHHPGSGGTAAVFSGSDEGGYGFCLVTRAGDLRQLGKEMTRVLNGRGGGKPSFQQGRVNAKKAEIETFFTVK